MNIYPEYTPSNVPAYKSLVAKTPIPAPYMVDGAI